MKLATALLNIATILWPSARGYTSNWPTVNVKVDDVGAVGKKTFARSKRRAELHAMHPA